jgi:hypothetical protein
MKQCSTILFLLLTQFAFSQKLQNNFRNIDWQVMSVDAPTIDSLVKKITFPYKTDLEKVRSIFSWIAQNINYNYRPGQMRNINGDRKFSYPVEDSEDTFSTLKPLNRVVAEIVFRKRTAICDGYARLFKTFCDEAGITSEIISGYARADMYRTGQNFHTNHTWNAVKVDGNWYLLDVTWASGYFSYYGNEFIKYYDDQYFLSLPGLFVLDHFPEDLQWTLLADPPPPNEFRNSPFKSGYFIKYNISSYQPSKGIIKAALGDTIHFQLQLKPIEKNYKTFGGSINDSVMLPPLPNTFLCMPVANNQSNIISYNYVVNSPSIEWLQLVYNDDVILRYKLDIRREKNLK